MMQICLIALSILLLSAGAAPATQRVVAIGDIHGDFEAFVGILQRARLVDPGGRWSGGNATLVQTGDFLDRGPKARAVMDLLMTLQREANRQSGRVIVLMGNHEAMNVYGDLRYVTDNDYAGFADDKTAARHKSVYASRPPASSSAAKRSMPRVGTGSGFAHCLQSRGSTIPYSCTAESVPIWRVDHRKDQRHHSG